MFRLAGFATEAGGTTGGQGDPDPVTISDGVTLYETIKNKEAGPLTIYINGTITPANSGSYTKIDIKDVDDISIIGVGTSGDFNGIGIKITRASNIIIRNIKVHHVLIGDKDCISIEGPADHIWIDHCELYNEYQNVEKDYYDGLLDAKDEAEYLTYSWNYLHDSWKTMLCGSSESDTYDRKLTAHHNFFRNCNSRIPLFRGGTGHFFNNYYDSIASTAINSRIGACVLIENNYFKNTQDPWVSAYSSTLGGGDTVGNILDNCTWFFDDDTHVLPSCTPSIPYDYNDLLHDADAIPALVMAYAGVGKLDLGGDPVYTLSLNKSGQGSITKDPDKTLYDSADVVTLTAVPATDWEFAGWSGDTTSTVNPVSITMDANKNINALFTTDKKILTVITSGPGSVTKSPDEAMYDSGTVVTLTPVPDANCQFIGWSGDTISDVNPLAIAMDEHKTIMANFMRNPAATIIVQAEDACEFNGSIQTEHTGYLGSGFVDLENTTGSDIEWSVDALTAITSDITIRFAHGGSGDRAMKLYVNGSEAIASISFNPTGAWTTWDSTTVSISLTAGNNRLRLEALTGEGGPNLDQIRAVASTASLAIGNCETIPVALEAPTALTAIAVSDSQINISWTDNSLTEDGFKIEAKTGGGSYSEIATVGSNVTSYSNMELTAGTTYTYRVRAYSGTTSSNYSNEASATTLSTGIVETAANNLYLHVYPNPVANEANIQFTLYKTERVSIAITDIIGKKSSVLTKDQFNQGVNTFTFNKGDLIPGIYIIELTTGSQHAVSRIIIR